MLLYGRQMCSIRHRLLRPKQATRIAHCHCRISNMHKQPIVRAYIFIHSYPLQVFKYYMALHALRSVVLVILHCVVFTIQHCCHRVLTSVYTTHITHTQTWLDYNGISLGSAYLSSRSHRHGYILLLLLFHTLQASIQFYVVVNAYMESRFGHPV